MLYIKTKLRQLKWRYVNKKRHQKNHEGSNAEIFKRIYSENEWGKTLNRDRERPFFSGSGSHDADVVSNYVEAIREWTNSVERGLRAFDVGCGDFNIGSALLPYFSQYTAADVVPELIEYNRRKWEASKVSFMTLDITSERLPVSDVVLIREVLQHLSNSDISRALKNIEGSCKYLILTESQPGEDDFVANLDKPTGLGTRSQFGSGIDLQKPPFSLKSKSTKKLLTHKRGRRKLETIVFELG
jgi:2-polyprenyl-3-methyl-5-hydroxy-6-metoxy-1,4-benzoquinol methylase